LTTADSFQSSAREKAKERGGIMDVQHYGRVQAGGQRRVRRPRRFWLF
jgi:hypothetical protein